ncbi:MAG: formylglycine-generating enzyme family protein [Saprospiraceae bacterium]
MKYHTETLPSGLSFRLAHIPGGEFRMGSEDGDKEAYDEEKPAHSVRLNDFYLGEFAVTQDLWEAVTGDDNRADFKGARRPIENVSWEDIQKDFLPKLNQLTGQNYRLPTEAEWEYAARGGPYWQTENYRYAGSDLLDQVGWYRQNSGQQTQEVGLLLPNALGLYDMSGNVWEWCEDQWHGDYKGAPKDGSAWVDRSDEGVNRVFRGGSWLNFPLHCRVASRVVNGPDGRVYSLGFRLVLQGGG